MTAEKIYITAFDLVARCKGLKGKIRAQLRGSAEYSKPSSAVSTNEPAGFTTPSALFKKIAPNILDETTRAFEPSYLSADEFFFIEHGEDAGDKIPSPIDYISSDEDAASTHFSFVELRECCPTFGPSAPSKTREEPKETTKAIEKSSGAIEETANLIKTPTGVTKRAIFPAPKAKVAAPLDTIPYCSFIASARSSFEEVRGCYSNACATAPLSAHESTRNSKRKTETIEAQSGATVPPLSETSELDLQKATELQRIEQAELLKEAREERERLEKEYCEMQRQLKVDKAMREIWSTVGRAQADARE